MGYNQNMAIQYPPQYRYSLFKKWDRETFNFIKRIAKTKKFPDVLSSKEEKNKFLITLIRTQKSLYDWRDFLKAIMDQIINKKHIDVSLLNKAYPSESISKDVPAWVTYEEDKIVSDFIDELETRQINFVGTDDEIAEFIFRFILGQLGHDWEQTIMMIWEMLGDENKLSVKRLNEEMKNFDYLGLFD